ncbi:hypothetical protein D3Y55_02570 [Mesorhizobium sp. DCY119]|nr:hypothetical protein D3Y55_02570 [Mesorhizobium sp. DCY119]
MLLTPLETFFVEEFCRFIGYPSSEAGKLRVGERERSPVGFMTTILAASVPRALCWGHRVFDPPRIALVGPDSVKCGMMLFFDSVTGKLDSIEGSVFGEQWPSIEEPFFWSEIDRNADSTRKH